jgi:thiamine biosynthesis lipoprotein
MAMIKLARHAMATRFELVLHGADPTRLRAAGEEALDEVDKLEARLSLFRPGSEIANVNGRAALEPVRVSPMVFELLEQARQLHRESLRAFDITIAPLVRCWGFMGGTGRKPRPEELKKARKRVGMELVKLNRADLTVHFEREGVMIDLGAIGKGFAIDRAVDILREAGIVSGLIHGGTSTVYGIGTPPDAEGWKIALQEPRSKLPSHKVTGAEAKAELSSTSDLDGQAGQKPLATVTLRDEALSVSAVWGKFFEADGKVLGHVLDPRTGEPASAAVLAAVVLPSATETDALSTALLTLGSEGQAALTQLRPGMRTFLAVEENGRFSLTERMCQ